MNPRRMLTGVLVLATSAIAATISPVAAAQAENVFDWRRYDGTTINVALSKWVIADLLKPRVPEFEELTGITANVSVLPEVQNRQKVTIALTAGGKGIDVFSTQAKNEGLQYQAAGWYEPLDKYLSDPALTPADYGYPDDFLKTALNTGVLRGERVNIPLQASTVVLAYRKDLFEAAHLAVPTTFEELEAAARQLNEPAKDQYGICMRGIGPGAAAIVGSFFHATGGDWTDDKGNPTLSSPEVAQGVELYVRLLREAGPPGVLNIDWLQCQTMFAAGKVAMWIDVNDTMPPLLDAAKSPMADRTGFAVIPAGPKGRMPGFDSAGLAMYSSSDNKGAAWYFMLWATNAENDLNAQLHGVPSPRLSAWQAEEVLKDTRFAELRGATLETMQLPQLSYFNPPFVAVPEIRAIFGVAMTTALSGGDVRAALEKAEADIQAVRKKTGEIR